jgi:Fe-S-cluster containining protein
MGKPKYDCLKCVGYCCSIYERVPTTKTDVKRLARHHGISPEQAQRRFTKIHSVTKERVLKRKPDPILGETCMFFDLEKRLCSIYDGRPAVCREWPIHSGDRCVYFDVLQFERVQQENPDVVPLVQITFLDD